MSKKLEYIFVDNHTGIDIEVEALYDADDTLIVKIRSSGMRTSIGVGGARFVDIRKEEDE